MNTKSILIAATITALTPALATAEDNFVLALSVGKAELSETFDGFNIDTTSTAYRFSFGWKFNDHFTLEGGYQNFGRFAQTVNFNGTPTNVALKADGVTLGGSGSLPLSERVSLFARAGAFFWDGDGEINNFTTAVAEDANLYIGLGGRLAVNKKLSATLDGSRYDLSGTDTTMISIGFEYKL